jgi:hypothetical protein
LKNMFVRFILAILFRIALLTHKKTHLPKYMPKTASLKDFFQHKEFQQMVLGAQKLNLAEIDDLELVIPKILRTLNFVSSGSPYILAGVPGTNPANRKDTLWQHHPAMYYSLLAGTPIPEKQNAL